MGLQFESLEPRNLLAAIAEPISDPFAYDAVTVQQMLERAKETPYVEGHLVVAIDATERQSDYNWEFLTGAQGAKAQSTLMTVDRPGSEQLSLVQLDLGNHDIFRAMARLDQHQVVYWSSPNFYLEGDIKDYTPNDPDYPSQYHHPLMQNDDAWDVTLGDANILIGVTDDGVDLDHEDLQANIWVNPGEIAGNGIDDDGNGYIDDVNGWDFSSGNNDPNPNGGDHGTHVSGIAAGVTDNGIGIAGTSGGSTILPLQFAGVSAWTAAVINETFTYAADNGAHIVNTSYNINGWVGDPVFTAGIQYLHDNGVIHFNSGGNGDELNPARQAFEQTILVVSTDSSDQRSGFSNYGTGMDISAPGSDILSTTPDNSYANFSGTSMAAPNAAGVAALIWSQNPTWNNHQVVAALYAGADNIDANNPGFEGWLGAGRVNSFNSLNATFTNPLINDVPGLPANGTTVDDLTIDQFQLIFDQYMDPATVNNNANFELRSAGPDEVFDTADDVLIAISRTNEYMVGSNFAALQMDDGPLGYGMYRLTVSAGLTNPFGDALDGDGNGTGGDDYVHTFTLGAPPAGTVFFDAPNYQPEDTATITVNDGNAVDPIMVDVTSSGGDSETLTLTDLGSGAFEATIDTTEGAAVPGDGILNVALGETITVTYMDLDDGTGFPATQTDTAIISNIVKYTYAGPPVQFSDNTTVLAEIDISDAGFVNDIDVMIDLTHTYTGDLDFFLISPSGTRVELFTDVGGSGNDMLGTVLDDEAATPITDGTAPFTGTYSPEGSLSDFDGELLGGTWTLEMTDDAGQDTGELISWGMCIDVEPSDIFDITNTNDSGAGSLREAIENANAFPGTQTLSFKIEPEVDYMIQLDSALPAITDPVVIDATNQTGYVDRPIVSIDGSLIPDADVDGFFVEASGTVIRGLSIIGFDGDGIHVSNADDVQIMDNFIGLALDESEAGNNLHGVRLQNANNADVAGNTIGGNTIAGVYVIGDSSGNIVQGNNLGTNFDASEARANDVGVQVWSTNNEILDNVISGNDWTGVMLGLGGDNNIIRGNRIGTNDAGDDLGNGQYGMFVLSDGNTIGGSGEGDGNFISGNDRHGILMRGAGDTTIENNWIGLGPGGETVGNRQNGLRMIGSPDVTIQSNIISANGTIGLFVGGVLSPNTMISSNWIGLDATGDSAAGNGSIGVIVNSAENWNASNNHIAGNSGGMFVVGQNLNGSIANNWFGLNVAADTQIGNGPFGAFVFAGQNSIDSNVFAEMGRGVTIGSTNGKLNSVTNNYVGTDITETADWGGLVGVRVIRGAFYNAIENNVITNQDNGIRNGNGGSGNSYRMNSIYGNALTAIDNGHIGLQANDAGDIDGGPNRMQNSPDLSSAILDGSTLKVDYFIDSMSGHSAYNIEVEFYIEDGDRQFRTLLGTDTFTLADATAGNKVVDLDVTGITLSAGDTIVAIATDVEGNTSEVSLAHEVL